MLKPHRLFKYLSPERTDVLEFGYFRFTSPRDLNDPSECKPYLAEIMPKQNVLDGLFDTALNVLEDELRNIPEQFRDTTRKLFYAQMPGKAHEMQQAVLNGMEILSPVIQSAIWKKAEELIGIFSATETPDNNLMWAHYAQAHQGFVLELDPNSAFFDQRKSTDDNLRHLKQVVYFRNKPAITILSLSDTTPFLSKTDEWSYEKEWRMLVALADASRIDRHCGSAVHLFNYPKDMIKSVILGCKMNQMVKDKIKNLILNSEDFKGVAIYQATSSVKSYSIVLNKIV